MTYRLVERSNNWNARGEAINLREVELETFDSLGQALAFRDRFTQAFKHIWGSKTSIHHDVVDLSGRTYFNGDQWDQMCDEDTLERLFEVKKTLAELNAIFG